MMIASHTAKSVSSKMELCADSLRKSTTTSNSAEQMYAVVIRKIASSVEYQDTKSAFWDHTAAGPILHHTSVCEGIAKLFLFFCLRLSLPCAVITGTLNGAPHAWNVVEICGKRKYVDVTSFLRAPQAVYLFPKTLFRSKNRMIEAGYLWVDE